MFHDAQKIGGSWVGVGVLLVMSNVAMAIAIMMPVDNSHHSRAQDLGVYGTAPAGHGVSVTVTHGSNVAIRTVTADANGAWTTTFPVPSGGWTTGPATIKARDTTDQVTVEIDIEFVD